MRAGLLAVFVTCAIVSLLYVALSSLLLTRERTHRLAARELADLAHDVSVTKHVVRRRH
jgi:signal transduction histidine kinase